MAINPTAIRCSVLRSFTNKKIFKFNVSCEQWINPKWLYFNLWHFKQEHISTAWHGLMFIYKRSFNVKIDEISGN